MQTRSMFSTTIVISLLLSLSCAALFADDNRKNSAKGKISPTLVTHEDFYLWYDFSHTSNSTYPPDGPIVLEMTSTGNRYRTIGVRIPSNATITSLTMRAVMGHNYSSDNDRLIAYLLRANNYGGLALVKQVKANFVSGNSDYRTKSASFSVPASAQPYLLTIKIPGSDLVTDISYEVAWIKITYTTP